MTKRTLKEVFRSIVTGKWVSKSYARRYPSRVRLQKVTASNQYA